MQNARSFIRRSVVAATGVCLTLVISYGSTFAQQGEWDLSLVNGVYIRRVMIFELRSDSLSIDLVPSGYWIPLDSISKITRLRGSYVGEGSAAGVLLGALVGGVILPGDGASTGGHGFALGPLKGLRVAGFGLVGGLIGGVAGASINGDRQYELYALSRPERYDLLRRIFGEQ